MTGTREEGELVRGTVRRELPQELGVSHTLFRSISGTYRETNETYVELMGYTYKYRCICMLFNGNQEFSPTEEISSHIWSPPKKLDQFDIEFGARLVIDYYVQLLDFSLYNRGL